MATEIFKREGNFSPGDVSVQGQTFMAWALTIKGGVMSSASDTFFVAGPAQDIDRLYWEFTGKPEGAPGSQQELSRFVDWLCQQRGFVRLEGIQTVFYANAW